MSFSFGFTTDDLENDPSGTSSTTSNIDPQTNDSINPLDATELTGSDIIQPKIENVDDILRSLKDVRVSYEAIDVPSMDRNEINSARLFRRDLFDMKHQLMSEDNNTTLSKDDDDELDILMHEDLRKNIYEGGLKSWECSIDLVKLLNDGFNNTQELNFDQINCITEIGCGTALPSQYIFSQYLKQNRSSGLKLILTDYNSSALRLATIPNIILAWVNAVLDKEQLSKLQPDDISMNYDEEIMFSAALLEAFNQDIKNKNISLEFISGSWGRKFSNYLNDMLSSTTTSNELLVLTSETIYQPDHLPLISETLIELKQNTHFEKVNTMVAAKDIYFGVGGSLIEFENYLRKKNVQFDTRKVNAGLKRSIVLM
ncbi:similar to Saccharomyces cerevisiae YIL110W HPM1 AdoMet-dependent methyltransferase involved in a novel 3-methylhistidine modification of ribosomal protein Rpl3p [Maudiozyma saulgeensis]|uniref:protein-histidine N-methyltransferase n=1 Tax=Maudiozyma saulgeensis TaxID=1789683 RepID=A0A1X7R4R9_9SACH|nr:similar to Saccharomyces cerevisiae YIL110W HPM1 AdoMet-dependent methyltransferase involved in a novel 3-methylhistidine modification of ribosomal protein Rpl3p [Kazachstania saulgeensis]